MPGGYFRLHVSLRNTGLPSKYFRLHISLRNTVYPGGYLDCELGQVWYLIVSIPDLCTLTY